LELQVLLLASIRGRQYHRWRNFFCGETTCGGTSILTPSLIETATVTGHLSLRDPEEAPNQDVDGTG
jgi:hypothetical protein